MRHFKVDISAKKYMTAAEYDKYCTDYNISPVIPRRVEPLPEYRLYASKMPRAIKTAKISTSREPEILDGVYEVTFCSQFRTKKRLPFWFWEISARLGWIFNSGRQLETRAFTVSRLNAAADELIKRDEDAIVVMHRFVMRIFSRILKARGFEGKSINGAENGEWFLYKK